MWKTGDYKIEGPGSAEDATFLQAHKLKDGQDSKFLDDEHVQSYVKNVDHAGGWEAEMAWGFEDIKGDRRYTRRIVVWKNGQFRRARVVYDYKGAADKKDNDEDLAYGDE